MHRQISFLLGTIVRSVLWIRTRREVTTFDRARHIQAHQRYQPPRTLNHSLCTNGTRTNIEMRTDQWSPPSRARSEKVMKVRSTRRKTQKAYQSQANRKVSLRCCLSPSRPAVIVLSLSCVCSLRRPLVQHCAPQPGSVDRDRRPHRATGTGKRNRARSAAPICPSPPFWVLSKKHTTLPKAMVCSARLGRNYSPGPLSEIYVGLDRRVVDTPSPLNLTDSAPKSPLRSSTPRGWADPGRTAELPREEGR